MLCRPLKQMCTILTSRFAKEDTQNTNVDFKDQKNSRNPLIYHRFGLNTGEFCVMVYSEKKCVNTMHNRVKNHKTQQMMQKENSQKQNDYEVKYKLHYTKPECLAGRRITRP